MYMSLCIESVKQTAIYLFILKRVIDTDDNIKMASIHSQTNGERTQTGTNGVCFQDPRFQCFFEMKKKNLT